MKGILLATILTLTVACDLDAWGDSARYTEEFHFTHDITPGGRLAVENFNGSIEITAWDKNQVQIDGEKYASTRELLERVKIQVTPSPDFIQVRTMREPNLRGNMGARYRIRVPAKVLLDDIRSSNGPVRVDGVEKVGRLKTSNGPVHVTRSGGDVTINTSNGPVEIKEFAGSASVHTSNGPVSLEGVRGRLEVSTSNGPIRAGVDDLASGTPAKLRTTNGPITLQADGKVSTDVIATTSNGPITLKLPDSAGVRIKARTSNSRISSDLPIATISSQSKSSLDGTLGAGGPLLDLTTSNGRIRIERN
jgi:DUF4097 and DUF4098 domain-containing protein YvlB